MHRPRIIPTCLALALVLAPTTLGLQSGKPKLVREPVPEENPESEARPANPAVLYNPAKAEKIVNVGKYYFERGKWQAASGRFREALTYRPDYPDAYRWLARSLEKQKKYKEAAAALLEYEQKFPKSPYAEQLRKERLRLEQKG